MQKPFFVVIFLFLSMILKAQQPVELEGKILADSLEYTFINIINISSYVGTTNDPDGHFVVKVKENDTLQFSSVQYQKKEIVITKAILNAKFLEVFLLPGVNQLDEVYLFDSNLIGNLEKDFTKIDFYDKYQLNAPQLKQDIPSLIDRKLAATGGDPSNLLLNTITGERQKVKKIKANMVFDDRVEKALELIAPDNILKMGIQEDELMLFIYFCAEDELFNLYVDQESKGPLFEFFQHKVKSWKQRKS